jgi:hypothetical protein
LTAENPPVKSAYFLQIQEDFQMANIQNFDAAVSIPMTREMAYTARVIAAAQNISRTELLRRALNFYLENLPPATAPAQPQGVTREVAARATGQPIQSELADIAERTLAGMGGKEWDRPGKK